MPPLPVGTSGVELLVVQVEAEAARSEAEERG